MCFHRRMEALSEGLHFIVFSFQRQCSSPFLHAHTAGHILDSFLRLASMTAS